MAQHETIITINSTLAWSGHSTPSITANDDVKVYNDSSATAYWWPQGSSGPRTSLAYDASYTFVQETATRIYDIANSSSGAAQITLTVTGKPK
jgi:hypothetical protein